MFISLRPVAFVSMLYDLALGVGLLVFPHTVASLFGSVPPSPPVLANLLGLFALAVAACYLLPLRDPARWGPLLWVLGPLLKGGGAFLFIADHLLRGSPSSFLLFALTDGALALWTAMALLRVRRKAA
jgi:hypothetical protein